MPRQPDKPATAKPKNPAKAENRFNAAFRRAAACSANAVGSKWAFLLSVLVVLAWAATGPIFHFSNTWQLVINTGTTIVTFLMVFLIQNTQNRDAKAIQLKLDELLRGVKGARTNLVNLEDSSDEELEHLQRQFARLRAKEEAKAARPAQQVIEHADRAHQKAHAAENESQDAKEIARRARDTAEKARDVSEQALQHTGRDDD